MLTLSECPSLEAAGAPSASPAAVYLARLAPLGADVMRSALERMAVWLGWPAGSSLTTFPWGAIRYEHAIAIRGRLLRDPAFAPATSNRYLVALRRVAREAYMLGQMTREDYDRVASVPSVPGTRVPAGRALSPAEVGQMFDAATSGPDGVVDAAMLAVLFGCGLRRAELTGLDLGHLEEGGDAPALRVTGKGNRQRRVFLPDGTLSYLLDWIALRGRAPGPLFCALVDGGVGARFTVGVVYSRVQRLARQAELARSISPHDLRRTYITELLERGTDLLSVQGLAGHAQATTTARYDRRPEQARARAARSLAVPYRVRAA